MVCKSNVFVGANEQNKNWKNWNGDVLFSAEEYFEPAHTSQIGPPDGLQQLVHVVARATTENKRLKAIGSGWAFEDIAKSDSWVVCLKQLTRRLDNVIKATPSVLTVEWEQKQRNSNARLVHVEAGIEIGALSEMLQNDGLAMPTLGGSNGQSLAGAISTSTHGGDWKEPPFPDFVRAIHLVTDGGRELWIERDTAPITTDDGLRRVLTCKDTEIVRSDAIFNATLVSFGRFGVIYSFVLEVCKAFRLVEVVTTPARADLLKALRDGQSGTRLFGPLFTLLSNAAPPTGLTERTGVIAASDPYFFQILFNSQNPNNCWVTRRWVTTEQADLPASGVTVTTELTPAGVVLLVDLAFATAAALAMASIPVVGIYFAGRLSAAAIDLKVRLLAGSPTIGAILASALNAAWDLPFVGNLISDIIYGVLNGRFSNSIRDGRRGPYHLITSGTRAESQDIDPRSDSIEVVFDATTTGYLDFLNAILAAGPAFKQAGYVSVRPSRASLAELSMHNVPRSHAISIEVATIKSLYGNADWMKFVESLAIAFGGRPHWGQYNKLTEQQVLSLYHEHLINWRKSLFRVSMKSTIFSNNFTRQRGLEPINIGEVTADISFLTPLLLSDPDLPVIKRTDVSFLAPLLLSDPDLPAHKRTDVSFLAPLLLSGPS